MALKLYSIETGELDLAIGIALSLGYTVINGDFPGSIEMIDSIGEYQGYYDPNAGIGVVWIDDDSDAQFKFDALGGESWISNIGAK